MKPQYCLSQGIFFIIFALSHGFTTTTNFMRVSSRVRGALHPGHLTMTSIQPSFKHLDEALLLQGPVSTGYGRGSKKLGVPTANLPHFDEEIKKSSLVNGVYFGWGYLPCDGEILACVANIGKSPTFVNQENPVNIVEAYLLDRKVSNSDFYGSTLRLCLVGFLRPEQKFASFNALIAQINADIQQTRELCADNGTTDPIAVGREIATKFFGTPDSADSGLVYQRTPLIINA